MLFWLPLISCAVALVAGTAIPAHDVHVQRQAQDSDEIISVRELVRRNHLVPIEQRSDLLEKRAFDNKTFDLSWQREKRTLFSAAWQGASPKVPIGLLPVAGAVGGNFNLTMQCVDCRTYGNIVASLDDSDGLTALLTFNQVGAYIDLAMFASSEGTFTIGLGVSLGSSNVTGKVFAAGFGFSMDLILQVTGAVQANGGFQISIPDGETVGLDIGLKLNKTENGLLQPTSSINKVPKVNFSLLPISISDGSVNITAALRLKADAGITGTLGFKGSDIGSVSVGAKVGAHLTLIEVKMGSVNARAAAGTCRNALFIDADSNGGAFAQLDGSIGGGGGQSRSFSVGPQVSTTFWAAGTTLCLRENKEGRASTPPPAFIATTPAPAAPPALGACGTASLVTESTTVTSVYSMTTCAVPEMECPPRFNQVVVVTNVEAVQTIRCPNVVGGRTNSSSSGAAASAPRPTVAPVAPTGTPLVLTPIPSPLPVTVPSYANITVNSTGPVTGSFVAVTPPPASLPTSGTPPVDNRERPNSGGSPSSAAGAAVWAASGLFGVALVAVLL
ncbi:hypothetical protein RB594_008955 [Gaeumannomyces avenae]